MPTSNDTAWSLTVNDTIKAAMEELGILDPSTDPEADELTTGMRLLNGYMKSLQMRGATLAAEREVTVTTTPATASVTLDAAVRDVSSVRLIVSATNERRLWPLTRDQYFSLPNKTTAGEPTSYYLDRQRDAAILYLWPVKATAATLKLDYARIVDTATAGTETLDIRSEAHETLWTNLAVRLGPAFGVPVPESVAIRAAQLEMHLLDSERPDTYRFETDYDYA